MSMFIGQLFVITISGSGFLEIPGTIATRHLIAAADVHLPSQGRLGTAVPARAPRAAIGDDEISLHITHQYNINIIY